MLEFETDLIINTIRQRTQSDGHPVAVKDILAADIPQPVKMFFRAEVEVRLAEEQVAFFKSSRFPYANPAVTRLLGEVNSILALEYVFTPEEFQQRLTDVVHMLINYLIRPQWTLKNMLFEKEQLVCASVIKRVLRYFGSYEYLRELISRYIDDKNITTLTKDEFATFLWKADGEFLRRKSADALLRLMLPIYDFFDFPRKSGTNNLPAKSLLKFFEDKGLAMVIAKLDDEIEKGTTDLSRSDLLLLLEEVMQRSGAFTVERVEPREPAEFLEVVEEPVAQTRQPAPEPETTPPPVKETLIAIGQGDRKRFIKKIFRQNEDAYLTAIHSLQQLTTWKQASRYIDELFIQYDIDPYSSEAMRFIDVVADQYHPKP